tara:strand:- start:2863 stop:2979 length:117 start_codon:yes stop_codon:yes gene_type:complete
MLRNNLISSFGNKKVAKVAKVVVKMAYIKPPKTLFLLL